MPTPRVVTVKSSGGDYSSLNAAVVGESADLVALDRQLEIDCYNFVDTTAVNFGGGGGWTTDSTHFITIKAVDDHGGLFGGAGGTGAYSLQVSGSWALANFGDVGNVALIGLSVSSDANGAFFHSNHTTSDRCISKVTGSSGIGNYVQQTATFGLTMTCTSHIAIVSGSGATSRGFDLTDAATLEDVTIIGGDIGVDCSGGASTLTNVLVSGSGTCFNVGPGSATMTTCASTDTTATGTGARTSQTFTFVNSAGGDYHLSPSDAGAVGFGTDLSGDGVATDIDNQPIASPWNIGADQFAPTAVVAAVERYVVLYAAPASPTTVVLRNPLIVTFGPTTVVVSQSWALASSVAFAAARAAATAQSSARGAGAAVNQSTGRVEAQSTSRGAGAQIGASSTKVAAQSTSRSPGAQIVASHSTTVSQAAARAGSLAIAASHSTIVGQSTARGAAASLVASVGRLLGQATGRGAGAAVASSHSTIVAQATALARAVAIAASNGIALAQSWVISLPAAVTTATGIGISHAQSWARAAGAGIVSGTGRAAGGSWARGAASIINSVASRILGYAVAIAKLVTGGTTIIVHEVETVSLMGATPTVALMDTAAGAAAAITTPQAGLIGTAASATAPDVTPSITEIATVPVVTEILP